ncbi:ABC transporter permease [uncultured Paludibaculum sp.]|uniref:ABC transporter permease n=1 Tax=uncultured Paludibaculum sp. TaxID=1765020 RepID=UPI002AAAE5E5|nr:ABC transporter permease [uncultured Paludibaculum sp.]
MIWLRKLFFRNRAEQELEKELQFHLDQTVADLVARGHDPREAQRLARIAMGGQEQVKEACRDARGTRWLEDLIQDAAYALRTLRKRPEFAMVALLSIAVTVGVTSVVFAAVKAVVLDPLPYTRPQELVQIATDHRNATRSSGDWVFWNDALAITQRARTLRSVGVFGNAVFDLSGDPLTPPQALYGVRISATLFPTLGVSPMLGRNILPEEDQPGHANVIILSHGLWRRRFHSDPEIVGRTVTVNARSCLVIGIMPPGFDFPLRRTAARTPAPYVEFWAPLQVNPASAPSGALGMVARLRPGISIDQAQAEIDSISAALALETPATNRDRTHRLDSLRERTTGTAGRSLWFLMAAAVMFLLIGCVNVANLLLARGFARQREVAVRMAIGAGRARIIRQLLTESLVLAALGGIGGFAIAASTWRLLPAVVPASIPRLASAHADAPVLLFALAAAVITGLLFGIVPAFRSVGSAVGAGPFGTRSAVSGRHDHFRSALVVAEIAITIVLAIVGGQFGGRFLELWRTDPGFNIEHTFAAVVLPAHERYGTPHLRAGVYSRLLDAVRRIPGVVNAGTVDALPFSGENHGGFISAHATAPFEPANQLLAEIDVVGGDYLQALGVRLSAGRWFRQDEVDARSDTAVVDEEVARRLWPEASAVGRPLCVYCTPERPNNWKRVIGVVSSMRHSSLEGTVHHNVYLSGGALEEAAFLVVRTNGRQETMDEEIRSAVASVDPNQPVLLSTSMRSLVQDSLAGRRFILTILALTGCLALLMSAAGVYGVSAYLTSRRTQEIGIRMALGATPANVHALIFRQGTVAVLVGFLLGFVGGALLLRILRGMMEGFESGSLGVASCVAAVVMVSAMAACWIPARRAMNIEPVSALRME